MLVSEQSLQQIVADKQHTSLFWIIFNRAWDRIGKSRLLVAWELIAWSFIALRLGADIFLFYTSYFIEKSTPWIWATVFVLSPIFMGYWVFRVHVSGSAQDESMRMLPVGPDVILGARIAAVGWLWLRVFGPLYLFALRIYYLPGIDLPISDWVNFAVDRAFPLYSALFQSSGFFISIISFILFVLQIIGWFVFPISWGIYWGTRLHKTAWAYFVTYYFYLAFVILSNTGITYLNNHTDYLRGWVLVAAVFCAAICVLLPVLLFYMAIAAFGRRAK